MCMPQECGSVCFFQRTGKELITSLKSITPSCGGCACGCNVSHVNVVVYISHGHFTWQAECYKVHMVMLQVNAFFG